MDDALRMRCFESLDNLSRNRQRIVQRQRALGDAIGERWSLHEFEHERSDSIRLLEAENRPDIRMVQRRQQLRFALESSEAIGIVRENVRKNLECDVAIQIGIEGAIYLAHAARADELADFVDTEPDAARKGHMRRPELYGL